MGCHPSHWRTHIFQDGYCTTNQKIIYEDLTIKDMDDIVDRLVIDVDWLLLWVKQTQFHHK